MGVSLVTTVVSSVHDEAPARSDLTAEDEFDAIARGAASLCATPMAVVCLVETHFVLIRARVGVDLVELATGSEFLAEVLRGRGAVVVEDAAADARTSGDVFVRAISGARFIAGVPIRMGDDTAVGAVCVMDRIPRRPSKEQLEGLHALAHQVKPLLRAGRQLRALLSLTQHTAEMPGDAGARGLSDPAGRTDLPVRFGRYTLLDLLGAGATAPVYAAYDDQLERKVAIKLPHVYGDRRDRLAAQREAIALARLSHPNVVQIYEVGMFGDQPFISMEHVKGVTLTTWQTAPGRTLEELLSAYVQAGRGLEAMHGVGVIHRDFKPENILIDSGARVRLIDFGLARFAADGSMRGPRRFEGRVESIGGTPAYMAPEQHVSASVDGRADQFSFCAALYEALCGVRPFAGGNASEIRENAAAGRIQQPPPGRDVPEGVRALLLRGLSPEPAARWPSFSTLVDDLSTYSRVKDPTAAAGDRRAFLYRFVGLALPLAVVPMLARGVDIPRLVMLTSAVYLTVGVGIVVARPALLRNYFHRRMLVVFFVMVCSAFATRGLGTLSELPGPVVLWMSHLASCICASAFTAAGLRFMAPLAGVQAAAVAVNVTGLVPSYIVHLAASYLSVVYFAAVWSHPRANTGRGA